MTLYLLRHGIAEDARFGQDDHDRALTENGVRKLEKQALALRHLGLRVDTLLTSPRVRAEQTAAIVAGAIGAKPQVASELSSHCRLQDVADLWERHGQPEHLLCVGHQPDMSTLIYELSGARVPMRTGMLAVLEAPRLRPGTGTLTGLYDPDWLARIGEVVSKE